MNLPPCHIQSQFHLAWVARVAELENEGLDRSDAQGIADMEFENADKTKLPS